MSRSDEVVESDFRFISNCRCDFDDDILLHVVSNDFRNRWL